MIRSVLVPAVSLLLIAGVSGCATPLAKSPAKEKEQVDVVPLVRAVTSVRAPEGDPFVFAAALPAPFRVAVLQAAQFRRTHSKWPADRAELEREFGQASPQPYRLTIEPDGSLAIRWETAAGPGDVAVRLTTDGMISFSLTPAVDGAAALRASTTDKERQRLLFETAVRTMLDAISQMK